MRAGRQRPGHGGEVVAFPLSADAAAVAARVAAARAGCGGKVLALLDAQLPHVRGSVCAASAAAEAMWLVDEAAREEPSAELVGLRWALEEARHGLDALREDMLSVLASLREGPRP